MLAPDNFRKTLLCENIPNNTVIFVAKRRFRAFGGLLYRPMPARGRSKSINALAVEVPGHVRGIGGGETVPTGRLCGRSSSSPPRDPARALLCNQFRNRPPTAAQRCRWRRSRGPWGLHPGQSETVQLTSLIPAQPCAFAWPAWGARPIRRSCSSRLMPARRAMNSA